MASVRAVLQEDKAPLTASRLYSIGKKTLLLPQSLFFISLTPGLCHRAHVGFLLRSQWDSLEVVQIYHGPTEKPTSDTSHASLVALSSPPVEQGFEASVQSYALNSMAWAPCRSSEAGRLVRAMPTDGASSHQWHNELHLQVEKT